jgi:drug/metabolite transporter (DMT)-like permease
MKRRFFRNLISLLLLISLLIRRKKSPLKKESRPFLIFRGVFGTIGLLFCFYGIDRLILADSGMLNKTQPFFVTIFAFFPERRNIRQQPVCAFAFLFIPARS